MMYYLLAATEFGLALAVWFGVLPSSAAWEGFWLCLLAAHAIADGLADAS